MTQHEEPLDDDTEDDGTDLLGLTGALFGGAAEAADPEDDRLATDSLDDLRDQELDEDDDEDGESGLDPLLDEGAVFDDPSDIDEDDEDDDYASSDDDDPFDDPESVDSDDDDGWD